MVNLRIDVNIGQNGEKVLARLRQALRQKRHLNIVHYIGHGDVNETRGGYLVLEREGGQPGLMDGQRLSALLRDCRQMKLVTLNTCRGGRATGDDPFASIAMALARAHMPAIVAMQHEIHDQTAVRFSQEFYGRLTAGWSVYTAISEARIALYVDHASDIEWVIPVLYSRSPDGIIFKRTQPAAQ
jgi:CHAT domain-containing protein